MKFRGSAAIVLAGGLTVTTLSPAAADSSAEWDVNHHRYERVTSPDTWNQARAAAGAMSWGEPGVCPGYLATITSAAENAFIVGAFGAETLRLTWFGGIQPESISGMFGWTWANGETWSYANWSASQPSNDYYPEFGFEDATAFWSNGTWNDAPRTWTYGDEGGYLVEFDCQGVSVDVKPGSDRNTVNGNDRGVIPIAILTTEGFDAATVDPMSVTMNGAAAKIRGKSMKAGSLEDVDGDGDLDLVLQIVDGDGVFVEGSTTATILASTYDGTALKGTDTIAYVP